MCIQPFGLHLCGTAVEWTAWATIALAAVAAISIIVNSFLAWSTHASARSAKDQVALEREQLQLFRDQLTLAQEQFVAAQAAARPTLQVLIANAGTIYTDGAVTHVHGSQPAYDVEIWIRGPSREGEAWGLRHAGPLAFLVPGENLEFIAPSASAVEQERCPFKEFFDRDAPPPGRFLVGWNWKRSDGQMDRLHNEQTIGVGPTFG